MPTAKIVFNGPLEEMATYYIRIRGSNSPSKAATRVCVPIPKSNAQRRRFDGHWDHAHGFYPAIEETKGDKLTVEWSTQKDSEANAFTTDGLKGDGMTRTKMLNIDYNV
ncbi:hypothetical protein niasHT_004625 [Heterodera trifolii]|uniref:Uncharacterized protein n=1 Tax=Heterodera trifolii TaxID=157864 RepID=A0ABD2M7F6_9BILA